MHHVCVFLFFFLSCVGDRWCRSFHLYRAHSHPCAAAQWPDGPGSWSDPGGPALRHPVTAGADSAGQSPLTDQLLRNLQLFDFDVLGMYYSSS